jgi:hypothetical protein
MQHDFELKRPIRSHFFLWPPHQLILSSLGLLWKTRTGRFKTDDLFVVEKPATSSQQQDTMSSSTSNFDLDSWQRGGISSFDQTCYAEYWSNLPNVVEKGMTVDPYNFRHRMALGKYLLENTGDESVWGDHYFKHWYWAYLAQLDWQWRSGRLSSPTKAWKGAQLQPADDAIALDSWWGYMNLGFSVAVYCGAANAGLVPTIKFKNTGKMNLDEDEHFQNCVKSWQGFFEGPHTEYIEKKIDLKKNPSSVFPLYRQLWSYHTTTVRESLLGATSLEELMPEDDRRFGLGWCRMVEILDAMGWSHLSLESMFNYGASFLPSSRLDSAKTLEFLKEHRNKEYLTCVNMFTLYDTTDKEIHRMCNFWKRITHYDSVQATLPTALERLMHGNALAKSTTLGQLLLLSILPQSFAEGAIWSVLIAGLVAVVS